MSKYEVVGLAMLRRSVMKADKRTDLYLAKTKKVIEILTTSTPEELGSISWLSKMNAVMEAKHGVDDHPDVCTDHLIKHKKLTGLVRDMVMISLWRKEVLPQLLELESIKKPPFDANEIFCGGISSTIMTHETNCCRLLSLPIERPEILRGFGSDILDIIDHAIGVLKDFIEQKPDHDPSQDRDLSWHPRSQLSYEDLCVFAYFCVKSLAIILTQVEEFPEEVCCKLLHHDTELVATLVNLILEQPWCFSQKLRVNRAEKHKDAPPIEWKDIVTEQKLGPQPHSHFHPIQLITWQVLYQVSVVHDKLEFPMPFIPSTCSEKFGLIKARLTCDLCSKQVPDVSNLGKLIARECSNIQSPPAFVSLKLPISPYHASVRAELSYKTEQIVRIHGAMGTFEAFTSLDKLNRAIQYLVNDMNDLCFKCGKPEAELKCSRCRYALYCNRKCQKRDWTEHKKCCKDGLAHDFGVKFEIPVYGARPKLSVLISSPPVGTLLK